MEYHLAIKRKGVLTHATTWNEPWKHYADWKKPDTKARYYMTPFIWTVQNRQIHWDRKQTGGGALGWERREYRVTANGVGFPLRMIVVMGAQLYKQPKNHWIVHYKWVFCMLCELYLNKTVIYKIDRKRKNIKFNRRVSELEEILKIISYKHMNIELQGVWGFLVNFLFLLCCLLPDSLLLQNCKGAQLLPLKSFIWYLRGNLNHLTCPM